MATYDRDRINELMHSTDPNDSEVPVPTGGRAMNWKPVSELPNWPSYVDVMLWVSLPKPRRNGDMAMGMPGFWDGDRKQFRIDGMERKGVVPTHWSLITPPREGVDVETAETLAIPQDDYEDPPHCDNHSETQLDCPECVGLLPELTDAERSAMNAMGDDLVDRLWNGIAPSRTYCPDCGSYTETRLGREACTKDGCGFERFFSPPVPQGYAEITVGGVKTLAKMDTASSLMMQPFELTNEQAERLEQIKSKKKPDIEAVLAETLEDIIESRDASYMLNGWSRVTDESIEKARAALALHRKAGE